MATFLTVAAALAAAPAGRHALDVGGFDAADGSAAHSLELNIRTLSAGWRRSLVDDSQSHRSPVGGLQLTRTGRVFFLGPPKAGTTSLAALFSVLDPAFAPCHNVCDGVDWSRVSRMAQPNDVVWQQHRVFADHGDTADYAWLEATFPGSRFVLNTRSIRTWLTSRYDQVRVNRQELGCSAQGRAEDCDTAASRELVADAVARTRSGLDRNVLLTSDHAAQLRLLKMIDNDDDDVVGWFRHEAAHQAAVLGFFNATDGERAARRSRFTAVDVERDDDVDVTLLMRWVSRDDVARYAPRGRDLVLEVASLPPALRTAAAAGRAPRATDGADLVPLSNAFATPHPAASVEFVGRMLRDRIGCPEVMWDDSLYARCAAAARR